MTLIFQKILDSNSKFILHKYYIKNKSLSLFPFKNGKCKGLYVFYRKNF